MATRRKELEEKQRKQEEREIEDKLRREKQERLKERVIHSKALVDNSKALAQKRIEKQENMKKNLQSEREAYQQELARRLQRVYNKPLMFEQVTKETGKIEIDQDIRERLMEEISNEEQEMEEVNEENEEVEMEGEIDENNEYEVEEDENN